MELYYQGETAVIRIECSSKGVLSTPSSATMTVKDNTGQTVVDAQNMSNTDSETGKYHYNYDISATAETGIYKYEAIFTDASSHVTKERGEFQVDEKL